MPLGPILFLLYINDLPNATNSLPRLFADGTCLILSNPSFAQFEKNINRDLAKFPEGQNQSINNKSYQMPIAIVLPY